MRFRVDVVRRVGAGLYLLAAPIGLVGFLPHEATVWMPGVLLAMLLAVVIAAWIALAPPSVGLLRLTTPAGVAVIGLSVASSGWASSPFLELLLLPLAFAAAVFDRRTALPTLAAFLVVRVSVLVTVDSAEQLSPLVIGTVMELAVAVLVSELAERMVHGFETDRRRARMSAAATSDELEQALTAIALDDEIVAAAIVTVDGAVPTMAQIVASVGRGAADTGSTTRVVPSDSFARAAVLGPVVCLSDPHSDDAGARIGFARGYAAQAVLPLRSEGALIGHLVLCSDRREAFAGRTAGERRRALPPARRGLRLLPRPSGARRPPARGARRRHAQP
jgi:hypothetical protein